MEESKEFHRRMVEGKRFREGTGTRKYRKEVVGVIVMNGVQRLKAKVNSVQKFN